MFLSVFDIFKIGVGPSSSHTMGPMLAAARFLDALRDGADRIPGSGAPARLEATPARQPRLHRQGPRHRPRGDPRPRSASSPTPSTRTRPSAASPRSRETGSIDVPGLGPLAFDPDKGVVFDYGPPLPGHANGMVLRAFDAAGNLHLTETYYSIGGGFVLTERQIEDRGRSKGDDARVDRPYPFATAAEMLAMGEASGLSIAAMKRANETAGGHGRARRRPRPPLVGDGRLHRPRPRHRRHAARRPQGPPPRPRHPPGAARRARQQPRPAAHRQRLALGLRHGGQRGERRRRPGRHRADQRRRRRRPGGDPLLPRPLRRRDPRGHPRLPAHRRRGRRHHQDQRLDLRRRGRLPGRGRLRRRHGRRRPLRRPRRHATPRSRTPPRSRSSTTSA